MEYDKDVMSEYEDDAINFDSTDSETQNSPPRTLNNNSIIVINESDYESDINDSLIEQNSSDSNIDSSTYSDSLDNTSVDNESDYPSSPNNKRIKSSDEYNSSNNSSNQNKKGKFSLKKSTRTSRNKKNNSLVIRKNKNPPNNVDLAVGNIYTGQWHNSEDEGNNSANVTNTANKHKNTKKELRLPNKLRCSTKFDNEDPEAALESIVTVDILLDKTANKDSKRDSLYIKYPRSNFNILERKHTLFWNGYLKLVKENDTNSSLDVGEKINDDNVPLINDIFLTFNEHPGDFNQFLEKMVFLYQDMITERAHMDESKRELICVVTTTSVLEANGLYVLGFRLYFPYFRVSKNYINKSIINSIIKYMTYNKAKIFDYLSVKPNSKITNDMITNPYQSSMPLYGSTIHDNEPAFVFYRVYKRISKGLLKKNKVPYSEDPNSFFPVEHHKYIKNNMINYNDLIHFGDDNTFWLPLLLSVNYWVTPSNIMEDEDDMSTEDHPSSNSRRETPLEDRADTDELNFLGNHINMANELLPLLNKKRFSEDHYWLAVGKALNNIYNGRDEGLKCWTKYSTLGGIHTATQCEDYWDEWNSSVIHKYETIRTLGFFARLDNTEKYNNWHNKWYHSYFKTAGMTMGHGALAKAFYRFFWLDYTSVYIGKSWEWYKFNGVHMAKMSGFSDVTLEINGKFAAEFCKIRTKESRESERLSSNDPRKQISSTLIGNLNTLINKLDNTGFKSSIIKEATAIFKDENFTSFLNTNNNLMGVGNGVLECVPGKCLFREGKPEDYLTHFSKVEWNPNIEWKHPAVQTLAIWFHQCFMDKDLEECFLRFFASCIRSGNVDKIFAFFSGKIGNNSKSQIKKLIDLTFGRDYSKVIDEGVLADKKKSGGPSPELARISGPKIGWFVETDEDTGINNSQMKKISGDDAIFARDNYDNGSDKLPTAKLIVMCNKPPTIPKSEPAVYERLRIFPFLSVWKSDAPKDVELQYKEREFPKDIHFGDKLPRLAPVFLWMLVQKYTEYCSKGLAVPKVIQDYTAAYWAKVDPYIIFRRQCIEMVLEEKDDPAEPDKIDKSVSITTLEIYKSYHDWFKSTHPGHRVPQYTTVVEELSRRWSNPLIEYNSDSKRWYGVRLATNEVVDEEDEGDVRTAA